MSVATLLARVVAWRLAYVRVEATTRASSVATLTDYAGKQSQKDWLVALSLASLPSRFPRLAPLALAGLLYSAPL